MKEIIVIKKHSEKNTKHYIGLLLAAILIFPAFLSFSQNQCGLKFYAEKNRTTKTIKNSEYTYILYLENEGSEAYEMEVTAENISDCENPDGMSAGSNIEMLNQLMDSEMNTLEDRIELAPGEKIKLFLKVTVPEGSRFDAWNCTSVKAESVNCAPLKLVLHTFYPNPENLE